MTAKNTLIQVPPYAVEQAIKRLGSNLRTARLRRNLTIGEASEKIGTGPRAVTDAEKGKVSTSIAVYTALLWVYDLLGPMNELADPAFDEEGLSLSLSKDRVRDRAGALGFGLNKEPPAPRRKFNRTIELEKLQKLVDAIDTDQRRSQRPRP